MYVIKNLQSQLKLVIFMTVFASDVWCAEVDLSRLKMDDQLSKKSVNHYGSINDKRQDIGGFITLRDDGSSLKETLGGFKWRVILFGKPCGMESAKAEWLVFSIKEGEDQLSLQGSLRMHSEPVATVYDKVGSGKYGFEYFGYAVLVRSTSDPKKYLVKSDKKVLEQSPEKLEGLKSGQLLDKSWVVLREGVRPSEGIWFR